MAKKIKKSKPKGKGKPVKIYGGGNGDPPKCPDGKCE